MRIVTDYADTTIVKYNRSVSLKDSGLLEVIWPRRGAHYAFLNRLEQIELANAILESLGIEQRVVEQVETRLVIQ